MLVKRETGGGGGRTAPWCHAVRTAAHWSTIGSCGRDRRRRVDAAAHAITGDQDLGLSGPFVPRAARAAGIERHRSERATEPHDTSATSRRTRQTLTSQRCSRNSRAASVLHAASSAPPAAGKKPILHAARAFRLYINRLSQRCSVVSHAALERSRQRAVGRLACHKYKPPRPARRLKSRDASSKNGG